MNAMMNGSNMAIDGYPSIASKAKRENAEIYWRNETGLHSDDVSGRSYAPKGKTPIQRVKSFPKNIEYEQYCYQ